MKLNIFELSHMWESFISQLYDHAQVNQDMKPKLTQLKTDFKNSYLECQCLWFSWGNKKTWESN